MKKKLQIVVEKQWLAKRGSGSQARALVTLGGVEEPQIGISQPVQPK